MIVRSLQGILGAVVLLCFTVMPASAGVVDKQKIVQLLSESGYSVEDVQANMIAVYVGEHVVLIGLDGADADVSYITYLPGVQIGRGGHTFLSRFNSEVKFGRAYVDRDGDVALQMDRNSSGGVTIENIESDFDVFLLLISKFLSDFQAEGSV